MKEEGHPSYQDVLFVDSSTGFKFVCGSTLKPTKTDKFEGKEYPVFILSTSSSSHPFFTGAKKLTDSDGRVDKFTKRYANKKKQVEDAAEAAKAAAPEAKKKAAAKKKPKV